MRHYRFPPEVARNLIDELRPFGHESDSTIPFEMQVRK